MLGGVVREDLFEEWTFEVRMKDEKLGRIWEKYAIIGMRCEEERGRGRSGNWKEARGAGAGE